MFLVGEELLLHEIQTQKNHFLMGYFFTQFFVLTSIIDLQIGKGK